jgi:predicted naringenin-chalcone synthase
VTTVLRSVVTGVGGYLPEQVVSNDDLAKFVDTSDEWIIERTGIRQRHRVTDDQPVSDLAVEAARRALAAAGRTPADVDLIVVATTTPDLTFPPPRRSFSASWAALWASPSMCRRYARASSTRCRWPTASWRATGPSAPW